MFTMGKSIKLQEFYATTGFLNGSQYGCLRIEVKAQIIIYQIERSMISTVENNRELKHAGIYLLVNDEKHTLYVGQAIKRQSGDGLLVRILEPHASSEIDDWQYAYALTSNTPHFLGIGELCYLEQFFYDEALAYGHYKLLNSKRPTSDGVSPDVETTLKQYASYAFFLLENPLMRRIFKPRFQQKPESHKDIDNSDISGSTVSTATSLDSTASASDKSRAKKSQLSQEVISKTFYLKNASKNVDAAGIMSDTKSITVRTGATICQNSSLSNQKGQEHAAAKRQELIDKGVIVDFKFVKDYQFSSTTIAAAVILGQSANGITSWKDEAGKELKSYALSMGNP